MQDVRGINKSIIGSRIIEKSNKEKMRYSLGSYNKYNETEQYIRITEGCPHNCPFCYEPQKIKIFKIPKIIRNDVKIMDMNLLCKSEALQIISEFGQIKVNNKFVYYDLLCGIDYRFLTQTTAYALKNSRFKKIRLAWDWSIQDQMKIKDAINMLKKAGYKPNKIMIFMICNWKISFEENMKKLDLCKVWNVQVADCWYNNQTSPNIKPVEWNEKQIKEFRKQCRRHNQMINFQIDLYEINNKK